MALVSDENARPGDYEHAAQDSGTAHEQARLNLLDDLSAELEAEFGPISDEIRQQTRQTWPNYQGE